MSDRGETPSDKQTDANLDRFITAQLPLFDKVEAELTEGQKRSDWMWYIFPQLLGLGQSGIAQQFGITSLNHAQQYLTHPILGERLRRVTRLMLNHKNKTALEILGSPDDKKFRSCLTLFHAAATERSDKALFGSALAQFYSGAEDPRTLEILRG